VSGWAYLSRSTTELYSAYRYDLVSLAALADRGPNDTVLLSEFEAYTVRFVDAANPPRVVTAPGPVPATQAPGERLFALDLDAVRATVDQASVDRARPVAWDPAGNPTVWVVEGP
jgi:hypothetical protein